MPITFAHQIEPALFYMKPIELLPLYGTEWLLLALVGLMLSVAVWVVDHGARAVGFRIHELPARVLVAVAAISIGMGAGHLVRDHLGAPTLIIVMAAALIAMLLPRRILLSGFVRQLNSSFRGVALIGLLGVLSLSLASQPSSSNHAIDAAATATSASRRPNVVLISIDALSAQHMSLYGALRKTSPELDRFASEAIVFDHAYANGNFTTMGVSSLITGTRPWTHRALQILGRPLEWVAKDALPARLRAAGYTTASVSTNAVGGVRRLGFGGEFDAQFPDSNGAVFPCMDSISGWLPFWCTAMQNPWTAYPWILYLAQNVFGFHHDNRENHDYDPAIAESRASSWLHGQQARPIFLWVHFFPPHDPYATPKPWLQSFDDSPLAITAADSSSTYYYDWAATSSVRRRVLEARYEEAIAYVDHSVGELIADIQERLGPNTVIIVTADHGESFQHGYGGHGGPALYEELVHIPLIIKLPQPLNAPGRRSERVEQIDIAPTIADLAGIEKSPMWEGRSLVAVPSEPSNSHTVYSMNFEENPARGELTTGSVATLGGSWKLIEFMGRLHYSRMPKPETLLFDLTIDPLELHNVASEHPDIVRELAAQRATDMAPHQGPVAR